MACIKYWEQLFVLGTCVDKRFRGKSGGKTGRFWQEDASEVSEQSSYEWMCFISFVFVYECLIRKPCVFNVDI